MATHMYEWDGISYRTFTLDLSQPDPEPQKFDNASDGISLFVKGSNYWMKGSARSGFSYLDEDMKWNFHNNGLDSIVNLDDLEINWPVFSMAEKQGKIYVGTHNGLYQSTANIFEWEQLIDIPEDSIHVLHVYHDTLFTASKNQAFYSTDGLNWIAYFSSETKINDLFFSDGKYYVALENNGIQYSTKLTYWDGLNAGLNDLNVLFIRNSDEGLICGTATRGISYYADGQWTEQNEGIVHSALRSFAASPTGIYCNALNQVWYGPEGIDFKDITPSVDERYFGSVSCIGDTLILTYKTSVSNPYFERDNFLIFSYDKGATWIVPENQPPYWGDDPYRIVIGKSGFYAYEDDRMFYTEDMGTNWLDMPVPPEYCNMFYGALEYEGVPFASACHYKQMLKWEEGAWQLSADGLPDNRTTSKLFTCDGGIFAFINSDEIYVSTDEGNNWHKTNSSLPEINFMRSSTFYENTAFITSPAGIFYTDDYGNNWNSLNEGLPTRKTFSAAIYKDTLFVSTARNGLWKQAISGMHLSTNEMTEKSESLKLFPNPAQEWFRVNSSSGTANELEIRDISGRILLQKRIQISEKLNISQLAPGMYLVTLRSDGKIHSGKLVVTR